MTQTMPLENLVDALLESNQLCNSIKRQVSEVYAEIYAEAHQALVNFAQGQKPQEDLNSVLLRFSLTDFFKNSLYRRIDRLALRAKEMAIENNHASSFPPNHPGKQSNLTHLFNAIVLSGRLARPDKKYPNFPGHEDIYHEYLMQLWIFLGKNIHKFDLEKSRHKNDSSISKLMIFVNSSSHYLFLKAISAYTDKSIPTPLSLKGKNQDYQVISFEELEQDPESPETFIPLAEQLRELIEKDPQGVFSDTHLRNKPEANFREVALLSLQGLSMSKISEKLGCPQQSLYTFYKRCIRQFIPIFQEYLQE